MLIKSNGMKGVLDVVADFRIHERVRTRYSVNDVERRPEFAEPGLTQRNAQRANGIPDRTDFDGDWKASEVDLAELFL